MRTSLQKPDNNLGLNSKQGKNNLFKAAATAMLLLLMSITNAANRFSVASGNWNSTATWSATSGGAAGASAPVAGDIVTIENSFTVTVTANAACASIAFTTANQTTNLNINSGITLLVSGSITLPRAGTGLNTIAVGAGNLTVGGNIAFTSSGTTFIRHQITISTGTVSVSGNVTVDQNGGLSATITFTDAGLFQVAGSQLMSVTNIGGTLNSVPGATVEYNGTAQTVRAFDYDNLVFSGSGAKNITSGATVTGTLSMRGTATAAGTAPTYNAGSTLEYNGSAAQTSALIEFPATGVPNLTINNTNGVTLNAAKTITGQLTMTAGTLNTANTNLTVGSLTGSTNITNSTGTAGARTFTVGSDGTSPASYSGIISNGTATSVALTKTGTGTLTLSGANTYTGNTTVSGGILALGASGVIANTSPVILGGGTFSSGTGAGFSEVVGTLGLTASSTLDLGTGTHTLNFAASNAVSWTAGQIITVTDWTGNYSTGTSGTAGQLFVGTSTAGLTTAQLAQMQFFDGTTYYPAKILSTGEVVPFAQVAGSTYYAIASAAWNVNTTWSLTSGGAAVAAGIYPKAGDTVVIGETATGRAVTIPAGFTAACSTITMGTTAGTAAASSITLSSATSVLNVSGNITINKSSTNNNTNALVINDGTVSVGGDYTFGGTVTTGTGKISQLTITGGTLNITGDMIMNGTNAGFNVITMSGGAGTINLTGDCTVTSGTLTPGTTSAFNYIGASQTVGPFVYNNLGFSGSGTKTMQAATTGARDFTLSGTASATMAAGLTLSGNLTVGSGTSLSTGTGANILSVALATSVSGTLTLANTSAKTFTGNVTVNSGGVWNETGAAAYSFGGNLQNDATTFTANTGIHTFSGTTKTISGATATSIANLTVSGTVTNNTVLNVSGAIAGTGTLTNGATGNLTYGGASITPTLVATAVGNIVNYNGTTQAVRGLSYQTLNLSGSGAKTFAGLTAIAGNLSIGIGTSVTFTATTSTAASLTLGGYGQSSGTWGGTGSTATNINTTYFTAVTNGKISISGGTCTTGLWLGTTSTNWNTAANWCGGIPTATTDVTIQPGTPNAPTIATATTAVCRNITIVSGATLTLANSATALLNVSGDFTNNGTLSSGAASVVSFIGTGNQALTGSTQTTFANLTINTSTNSIVVTNNKSFLASGNLTITKGNFTAQATDDNYTISGNLSVASGATLTHNVDWDVAGKQMTIGGNIAIDGTYSKGAAGRSHLSMSGSGKTVHTGTSSVNIFTLGTTGAITCDGALTVDNNFWAMFGVAGGSFTTGANTVIANGAFLNSGGTVNVNGGSLTVTGGLQCGPAGGVAGNLVLSSGTLTTDYLIIGGGGAINGVFSQTGGTLNVTGDLTIASTSPASSLTCTNSPAINVGGNWINNGTYTKATETVTFNNNTTISGSSTNSFHNVTVSGSLTVPVGTVNVSGTWTNNGTFNNNSGTINLNGSALQTVAGTAASTFYNLTLNNTAGAILSANQNVNNTLTLTNGNLNISNKILTMGAAAPAVSGTFSATKMIVADGGGEMRKSATSNATASYTFPIGDVNGTAEYSPVTLAVTGSGYSSAYVGVSVSDNKHPNNASTTNFLSRYWNVNQSGITGCLATVTGTYINTTSDVSGTLASIKAAQLNGTFNQATNPWTKAGGSVLSGATLTYTGATITSGQPSAFTGITNADPTVSITGGGVPVCQNGTVTLTAVPVGDTAFTYAWTGTISGSTTNSTATPNTSTVGGPNSYTVTVKDGNGITSAASTAVNVTVTALPVAGTLNPTPATGTICAGTSVSATLTTGSGGTGTVADELEVSLSGGTFTAYTSGTSIPTSGQTSVVIRTRRTATGAGCTTSGYNTLTWTVNPVPTTATNTSTQSICANGSSAALSANTPTIGTGAWSVTGPSTSTSQFSSVTSPTASFTPAGGAGSYVVTWTISNSPCTASAANATITVNPAPTTATNTSTQTICATGSATLSANTPTIGTGAWSVTGPSTSTSQFSSVTSPTASFTPVGGAGSYVVTWTISNAPCTASAANATITVNPAPTTATNTSTQTICATGSATLSANTPTIGTGAWSVTGPSTSTSQFSSVTSPTASFTPAGGAGSYVVTWTISNSPCTASAANATITVNPAPTTATNTSTQTICATGSATLSANTPTIGTGAWSVTGPSTSTLQFSSVTSPTASFTPAGGAGSYVVTWTISNSPCTASAANATITVNPAPTTATNTSTQTICATGSATLSANTPTIGTGAWSVTGPSTSTSQFSSVTSPTASFTPAGGAGSYVVTWTISNSPCTASAANATITVNPAPTTATNTSTQTICATGSATLSGNTPIIGSGVWSVTGPNNSTSQFSSVTNPTASFTPAGGAGSYVVTWTISNSPCTASTANATITVNPTPTTATNTSTQTICATGSATLSANTPTTGTGAWSVTGPSTSTAQFSSVTNPAASFTPAGGAGSYVVTWTISNSPCTASTANATITVNPTPTTATNTSTQTICATGSATLSANTPTTGTGAWSVTGPSTSTAQFSSVTNPTASFTPAGGAGSYVVTWTISNSPCSASAANATITVNPTPTTATNTSTQTICATGSATLSANTPTTGTGAWSVTGPSTSTAQFSSVTSPTASFTPAGGAGSYIVTWTISNSPCTASSANATITVNPAPTTATNTSTQTICATGSATLSGNTPTTGTGSWSVTGPSNSISQFSSITSPTASFTPAGGAGSYVVTWTISNSPCTASAANATITVNPAPTTATNTSTQAICATGSATLSANTPTTGTGAWSVTGPSTSTSQFSSVTSPTASFTPAGGAGSYVVTWTISNSPCTASAANATITVNPAPTTATNTSTQTICATGSATLSANIPVAGTGVWSVVSGPSLNLSQFSSISSATATFTPDGGAGSYVVRWTISNSPCTASTADATITVNVTSVAGAISGGGVTCSGSDLTLTLSGNTGTIQWQSSTDNITFSDISGQTGTSYTASNITSTTYYRVVVTSGACASSASASVSVGVGASTTWTGSWSNGVPTSTMTAIISSNFTATANLNACTLTVNGNAVVSIPSGYDVTLNGALTVGSGSTFTLENNANLLQVTSASNSGSIVVKRNSSAIKRLDYTLWSSPVAGQNLLSFSPLTLVTPTSRFYQYNSSTNQYNGIDTPGSVTMADAQGYLIRVANNHPTFAWIWNGQFGGVPHNGNYSYSMYNGGPGLQFNLVGNPYPSPISAVSFASANSSKITQTLYFWRETNNNTLNNAYCSWSPAGGGTGTFVSNGEAQVVDPLGVIQTGQGFFVEATGTATGVDFTNSMRVANNANQFFRHAITASPQDPEANRIWLNVTNAAGAFCQTAFGYVTGATQGYDLGIDGRYINDGQTELYSIIEGQKYVIQGRALPFTATDIVPLGFKATAAGDYTIAIDHLDGLFTGGDQLVYLKDNLTGVTHDLATPYTFTSDAGEFTQRFEVVYQPQLGIGTPSFDNQVVIIKANGGFAINSGSAVMDNVKVFDIRGRLLVEQKGIGASTTRFNVGETNEVLIVKITSDDRKMVVRKVIN